VVDRTTLGKPVVILKGKAKMIAQKYGDYKIHLSISHGEDNAIAYAVLETYVSEGSQSEGCNRINDERN
jgi:holo-[acyl-carrier protein] synthase